MFNFVVRLLSLLFRLFCRRFTAPLIFYHAELINELQEQYPVGEMIVGEQAQKEFIKLYGAILKIKNILSTFDEFTGNEILTERDVQDYHSM